MVLPWKMKGSRGEDDHEKDFHRDGSRLCVRNRHGAYDGHCADRVVKEILMFFARIDDLCVLDFNGEGSPLASFGSKSSNRVSRT
jgi:hypothetical protein